MNQKPAPRSELRSYVLRRKGHFDAAHYLPNYMGKCAVLHGHRWETEAIIEFPFIPREMVSHDDPDVCGMLVDFHDIDELWKEFDHPQYGALNEVIPNPTAEVIANILLEALCDLVEDSLGGHNLPFNATIILWESPDSCVEVSAYQPSLIPTEGWEQDEHRDGAPWTDWLCKGIAEVQPYPDRPCNCPQCSCKEPEEQAEHDEANRQAAHRRIADTVTSL
jgi:6-pyruvoyltetrahydropterin/6-carboxytetrahydropterin synthase